jgi:hypothetical protein
MRLAAATCARSESVVDYGTSDAGLDRLSKSENRQDRHDDNDQADDVNNAVHEIVSIQVK